MQMGVPYRNIYCYRLRPCEDNYTASYSQIKIPHPILPRYNYYDLSAEFLLRHVLHVAASQFTSWYLANTGQYLTGFKATPVANPTYPLKSHVDTLDHTVN